MNLSFHFRSLSLITFSFVGLLGFCLTAQAKPTISAVFPATATVDVSATLSATITTNIPIQSCNLYVDLADVGSMTVSGNTVSKPYTFTSGGSRVAFVFCRDTSGGASAGPNTAIWVEGAIVQSGSFSGSGSGSSAPVSVTPVVPAISQQIPLMQIPVVSGPPAGSLLKLECTAEAGADDPCKAVYYLGKDGKRHSFPNAKVFFTWYPNFDNVVIVSSNILGSIPIGKNVTYRPGSRLVKFTTLSNVYAVSKTYGLRWVTSETVALATFGADWSEQIDDISDTFYANYTFGSNITTTGDYKVTTELDAAKTIDDIL